MTNKESKALITERNKAVAHELPIIQKNDIVYVDARLLHQKLKSKQDFSNWIKNRILDYGFKEREDFSINLLKSTGGRKSHEYLITLGMAKELAMVERTETGRRIRRYFIEAEQELQQKRMYGTSHTITEIRRLCDTIPFRSSTSNTMLYNYRQLRVALGHADCPMNSGYRRRHGHRISVINGRCYISEELVKKMIYQRSVREQDERIQALPPLLMLDFEKGGSDE